MRLYDTYRGQEDVPKCENKVKISNILFLAQEFIAP